MKTCATLSPPTHANISPRVAASKLLAYSSYLNRSVSLSICTCVIQKVWCGGVEVLELLEGREGRQSNNVLPNNLAPTFLFVEKWFNTTLFSNRGSTM